MFKRRNTATIPSFIDQLILSGRRHSLGNNCCVLFLSGIASILVLDGEQCSVSNYLRREMLNLLLFLSLIHNKRGLVLPTPVI